MNDRMIPSENTEVRKNLGRNIRSEHHTHRNIWIDTSDRMCRYYPGLSHELWVGIATHDENVASLNRKFLCDNFRNSRILNIIVCRKIYSSFTYGADTECRGARRLGGCFRRHAVLR